MPHFKTLVVDDFEGFRGYLCSALSDKTQCEVVGEASDGLEAIQLAEQLKPDLILLDLGLPKLNGIEAARHIRQCSPASKILFFTANCSREIAERALSTGAHGYLLKSDATELSYAIEIIFQGSQFVSSRVKKP